MSNSTTEHTDPPRASRTLLAVGAMAVVALAGAFTAGTLPRLRQDEEVRSAAVETATAVPRVVVAEARASATRAERVLPGNAQPLLDASLYARTTGYLKLRNVDIGDRVREGQVLAEISAPDIDDQLAQARANLSQARANLVRDRAKEVYAASEEKRYRRLVSTQSVSEEEYESMAAAAKVATATVLATEATIQVNEATVQRFTDLQSFQKIVAPFPGVITARNVDPGDLISADSPSTTRELFHFMRTDVLRVFVNVPQVFATDLKVGQGAKLYRREEPQKEFAGKVTRTADALDTGTRTLLTEVQVPNPDGALRAGMYLQVKLVFDRDTVPVLIPTAALATRADGPRVAVMDAEHRVHYRAVQLGRDYGAEIEVASGLKAGETVVVHPGDDLAEGAVVEPVGPSGAE